MKKNIELLSPVGDFECLKAAVQNGADSVYFGATSFNARSSASNFDLDTLKEAISYAKLRNVNTHLTLNTLIKDNEFNEAIELAKKAYEYGIDAIIVQDLGLAKNLITNFPDLPIHASTQMSIHNLEGVLEAQKLGFKRVVLSRELSLEEIEYICSNTNIEIETFIHGALCISYSGQCLFSSMIGGRSGNRGKCAQPCRLPYKLVSQDKNNEYFYENNKPSYLLSTKDLCGLEFIPNLIKAGVMCFKIEGRMKSPEYVATVTRIYRKYIDLALSNKEYKIDEQDKKDLAQVFNRGGFSSGHLNNLPNQDLVYDKKQNHIGIYLGNVSNFNKGKGHIFINLNDNLSIGDSIQFEKESTKYTVSELIIKNKNLKTANAKQFVEIGRMKGNINIGDKIYKIASKELSNNVLLSYSNDIENKKIKLDAHIEIRKDKPITLNVKVINDENISNIFKDICVNIKSDVIPVEAISKPIDKQRIISQLSKTTNTIFEFKNIDVILDDNLFITSISFLNELRRNALDEITNTALNNIYRKTNVDVNNIINKNIKNSSIINNLEENNLNISKNSNISILLNTLNLDYDYSKLNNNINNVYIPLKFFSNKKYSKILTEISSLFNIYIYMPTVIKSNYRNLLSNFISSSIDTYNIKGFIMSNISAALFINNIKKEKHINNNFEFIANYTLNIYNNYSVNELKKLKFTKFTISPELDKNTITDLTKNSFSKELIIYGNTPLMSSNYCLLGKTNRCYPDCGTRCLNEDKKYFLEDRLGLKFRIISDNIQTVTTIYNSKITSISTNMFNNIDSFRVDLLDENINEINNIIDTVISNKRLEGNDYTNGNLNREI